jgi:hypothetical protein
VVIIAGGLLKLFVTIGKITNLFTYPAQVG